MPLSPISDVIDELRRGRMVVIMDDEDRENEGDLLIAAACVRPEDVNFMARFGRGLICLTLTPERCRQLNLPLMVQVNGAPHSTKFTVSIEAARGVTTGISAADRATTVRAAVAPDAKPSDLVQPGHVFPLMASRGGVLARAGHTEAGVDLARLAGFEPASVICEILKDDGSMARMPELEAFAREHALKIGTIADLIRYRMENESSVRRVAEGRVSTEFGAFRAIAYHDDIEGRTHLALVHGEVRPDTPLPVRVHVNASLVDLIDARPLMTWSLRDALARVAHESCGVVVIVNQPESSQGLIDRLQGGARSPRAGRDELRMHGLGSQILADLGARKLRVLGHPAKTPGMSGFGLEIVDYVGPETELLRQKKKLP